MRSRNWKVHRAKLEAIYGKPCSLKPSTFQPEGPPEREPLIVKPTAPAPPGSVTAALAAMMALVEEPTPPPPVLSQEEQSALAARREHWRLKKQRQRANHRREWESRTTNATKNDKLHRYFRSVLKGNGVRGGGV